MGKKPAESRGDLLCARLSISWGTVRKYHLHRPDREAAQTAPEPRASVCTRREICQNETGGPGEAGKRRARR